MAGTDSGAPDAARTGHRGRPRRRPGEAGLARAGRPAGSVHSDHETGWSACPLTSRTILPSGWPV